MTIWEENMLKDRVAVVTGGTRGIGYEVVRKFLCSGAKVALFGSRKETVDIAVENLKKENDNYNVLGLYPRLNVENDVRKAFDEVKKNYGEIDILVNNAGISSSTPITNYTDEEFENICNLNIKGVFVCCKIVIPYLRKEKSVILNTSSVVSIYGQPSGCMYPASKFAVNGLTKSLARELAKYNIRVNAVAPGIIETDMVKNLPDSMIAPLFEKIPLKRIGKPEDVANAFLFLASDMSSYITGEILQVDGAINI